MDRDRPGLAGLTVALVGFASSFAVVLAGLRAVGATPGQAASGLVALCLTQGLGMVFLAHRHRVPLTLAWSTPGAALLAGTGAAPGGWPVAVGAFVVTGVLVLVTAFWPLLGRVVAAIPAPIAQAMLAGVLFGLCLAPFRAVVADPVWIAPLIMLWLVLMRVARSWAAAVLFGAALVLIGVGVDWVRLGPALLPRVELVVPGFSVAAVLGLALPLYLVTMASQNVPGAAVISSFGYSVPWRSALAVTGAGTLLGACAGGHAINLAAITAALGASPEAHRDPAQRWRATATAGWVYLGLGVLAPALVVLASAGRPGLLETVAGLALLPTLAGALAAATTDVPERVPAAVTFLIAASGVSLLGVGAAFWALVAGLVVRAVLLPRPRGLSAPEQPAGG